MGQIKNQELKIKILSVLVIVLLVCSIISLFLLNSMANNINSLYGQFATKHDVDSLKADVIRLENSYSNIWKDYASKQVVTNLENIVRGFDHDYVPASFFNNWRTTVENRLSNCRC